MDAVKFLKEAKRMCEHHDSCHECPAFVSADGDVVAIVA